LAVFARVKKKSSVFFPSFRNGLFYQIADPFSVYRKTPYDFYRSRKRLFGSRTILTDDARTRKQHSGPLRETKTKRESRPAVFCPSVLWGRVWRRLKFVLRDNANTCHPSYGRYYRAQLSIVIYSQTLSFAPSVLVLKNTHYTVVDGYN